MEAILFMLDIVGVIVLVSWSINQEKILKYTKK
jgi:hypothetical protein